MERLALDSDDRFRTLGEFGLQPRAYIDPYLLGSEEVRAEGSSWQEPSPERSIFFTLPPEALLYVCCQQQQGNTLHIHINLKLKDITFKFLCIRVNPPPEKA